MAEIALTEDFRVPTRLGLVLSDGRTVTLECDVETPDLEVGSRLTIEIDGETHSFEIEDLTAEGARLRKVEERG